MTTGLTWTRIESLLIQGKWHELPVNFSITCSDVELHNPASSYTALINRVREAIPRCGWDIQTDIDFFRRTTTYIFQHNNPTEHANDILRAAGHHIEIQHSLNWGSSAFQDFNSPPTIQFFQEPDRPIDEEDRTSQGATDLTRQILDRQLRQLMAAAGLPPGYTVPQPSSTIQQWANQSLGQPYTQPPLHGGPLAEQFIATAGTSVSAPPPPKPKPLPVHIPCGIRKIHRAAP